MNIRSVFMIIFAVMVALSIEFAKSAFGLELICVRPITRFDWWSFAFDTFAVMAIWSYVNYIKEKKGQGG